MKSKEPQGHKGVFQRIRGFDLHKALFILPNAFTTASIFCGMYAILYTSLHSGPQALYHAAIAIFFSVFFDMFDGRVARLTKTQSEFGTEFDSLADVISFGVAPAAIVYKWALWPMGPIGMLCAISFTSCGAIRLARFNVLSHHKEDSQDYFIGLPIPIAASMLISLVIAHHRLFEGMPVTRHLSVLSLVLALAFLMISNVSFWTFKNVKFGKKTIYILFSIAILLFIAGLKFPISLLLVVLIGFYILAGIIRETFLSIKG